MSLAYVASLALPILCPQLHLAIGIPALQLSADLTGFLAINASLTVSPPTIGIYLTACLDFGAALALSVSLPTVAFDASVSISIEASFNLSLSLLLSFDLGLSLSGFLSAHIALYAFAYEGTGNALGAALTTELASTWPDGSPTSGACTALIFGATTTAGQAALEGFLNGLGWGAGLTGVTLASLAALTPMTASAETQATAAIQAKADAQAAITASLGASVDIPDAAATLAALVTYEANLTADLGLAPPDISVAISATASLAANISARAGLMAAFGAVFGTWAGIFVYTYSGTGAAMGAAVTTALASHWGDGVTPTSSPCAACVLATTDTFTASVLAAFFGGA